jgi:hypothetical protein
MTTFTLFTNFSYSSTKGFYKKEKVSAFACSEGCVCTSSRERSHKTPHINANKMLPEVNILFTSFHYNISDYATEKHTYCRQNWKGQEFK